MNSMRCRTTDQHNAKKLQVFSLGGVLAQAAAMMLMVLCTVRRLCHPTKTCAALRHLYVLLSDLVAPQLSDTGCNFTCVCKLEQTWTRLTDELDIPHFEQDSRHPRSFARPELHCIFFQGTEEQLFLVGDIP